MSNHAIARLLLCAVCLAALNNKSSTQQGIHWLALVLLARLRRAMSRVGETARSTH
jgi:hypothetical protein